MSYTIYGFDCTYGIVVRGGSFAMQLHVVDSISTNHDYLCDNQIIVLSMGVHCNCDGGKIRVHYYNVFAKLPGS